MNARSEFSRVQRIVVKVGTATLAPKGQLDAEYIAELSGQFAQLHAEGRELVLVSSGAIGLGAAQLSLREKVRSVELRQACAAVGQPLLMYEYRKAFSAHRIHIAQVLLSRATFNHRASFLALKNNIETLFSLSVLPILNENDSVSTVEIDSGFGDNDILSALTASKLDAQLLVILSNIDGMYAEMPRRDSDAQPLAEVRSISQDLRDAAGPSRGGLGSGGMRSKLEAVEIAQKAGCSTVLAQGRSKGVLQRILAGEEIGTWFPAGKKLKYKKRWILQSQTQGSIFVDEGAIAALRRQNSLLSKGVTGVKGVFDVGAVVMVNDVAKLVTNLSSKELQELTGRHSSELAARLGNNRKLVARPNDIVFLDES